MRNSRLCPTDKSHQNVENQYDRRATTMAATAPKAMAVDSALTEKPWNMSQCAHSSLTTIL